MEKFEEMFGPTPEWRDQSAIQLAPHLRAIQAAKPAIEALDLLYQRQAKVLGVVFNRTNASSRSYYYYKYADYYPAKARDEA